MDKAILTAQNQAASKDTVKDLTKEKGKETVQATNAANQLRQTLQAEAPKTSDLESRRTTSASASADSENSKLRGVYSGAEASASSRSRRDDD